MVYLVLSNKILPFYFHMVCGWKDLFFYQQIVKFLPFQEKHDSKEAAEFLKKEYGIGGGSHALAGADHSWQDHNFKGIELKKGNICEPYAKVLLSWKVVEKRIRKLVAEDKYLSPAGKEAYARYKEEEAQKALGKSTRR